MRSISAAILLAAALCPVYADARSSACRAKGDLPVGSYKDTCSCHIANCDYLVCTCGQKSSSTKITGCFSQSFRNVNGVLTCD